MSEKAKKLIVCVLVCLVAQISCASVGVNVGQEAPDFSLKDTEGKTVKLKDFRGDKIVVLDFWASWCGPCRRAIPELNRIQKDYAEKGVQVLGINIREKPAAVVSFKRQHMVKYRILLDLKGTVAGDYRVKGIPNLIVIDKDGVVKYNGHSPSKLKDILRKLVK